MKGQSSLFFPRFDPDFICNASDNSGRYSYQAQPAICRWNLGKLAEALAPELPAGRAKAVLEEYMDLYNGFYLATMRKKLGLLRKEEPEDETLITTLLQTMQNTGETGPNTGETGPNTGETGPNTMGNTGQSMRNRGMIGHNTEYPDPHKISCPLELVRYYQESF